jgi:hypothetical protein
MSSTIPSVARPESSPPVRAYTINTFIKAFPISRTSVYAEIKAGRLQTRKVAGRTLIATEDAEDWFSKFSRHAAA